MINIWSWIDHIVFYAVSAIFWSYSDYACDEMFKHVYTKRINIIVKDTFFSEKKFE